MNRKIITGVVCSLLLAGGIYLFSALITPKEQGRHEIVSSDPADASQKNKNTQTYNSAGLREKPDIPLQQALNETAGKTKRSNTDPFVSPGGKRTDLHRQDQSGLLMSETDLHNLTPEELGDIVLEYGDYPLEDQGQLHQALNRLCSLGLQGSHADLEKLIDLSYQFDDHRILHQILQTLGQTSEPNANDALFDALRRNLDDSIETTRISSYLAPSPSGALDPSIVDKLISFADDPLTNADTRKVLVNTVFHRGGAYGREQVGEQIRDMRRPEIME